MRHFQELLCTQFLDKHIAIQLQSCFTLSLLAIRISLSLAKLKKKIINISHKFKLVRNTDSYDILYRHAYKKRQRFSFLVFVLIFKVID